MSVSVIVCKRISKMNFIDLFHVSNPNEKIINLLKVPIKKRNFA